jgi:hypothetical protein
VTGRSNPDLRTISGANGEVHLEPQLMQVLVLLAEHAGQVVSKERLLETVWADTFVGDEVLSRSISEAAPSARRRVHGTGGISRRFRRGDNRLIASVNSHEQAAAEAVAARIGSRISGHSALGSLRCCGQP